MLIAHVAPFAPNRCGLYEAARDMARADIFGGNDVVFVDSGITIDGKLEAGKIGAIDNRGDFQLITSKPDILDSADIVIMHTGVNDSWLVRNQIPLIWVVHGRPLACFRPERIGKNQAYSLYNTVSSWKRTKAMLYFWNEFIPHWENVLNNKDVILPYPVIDEKRFNNKVEKYKLNNQGDINILICDSEREDIDLYELVVGLIETSKEIKNIKYHFFGIDTVNGDLPNCWNILLNRLKKLNCLGDIVGRVGDMEKVYNAVDCVISPNKIITRTIGESLSCGIPVISQNNSNNLVSDYTCDMSEPLDIKEAIKLFVSDFKNKKIDSSEIIKRAKVFSLEAFSNNMNEVYKNILG